MNRLLTPDIETIRFNPRVDPKLCARALLALMPISLRELELLRQGVGGGAGFVNSVEASLLDHFFTDPTYTPPSTMHIGLSTTTPTETGTNYTEPSSGAYGRVSTAAADWSAASTGDPAAKTTTAVKTFTTASGDWSSGANMTHFGLSDAASAGNVLCWGALTVAKPVLNGDTASFAAGGLTLKLGDPGDTY